MAEIKKQEASLKSKLETVEEKLTQHDKRQQSFSFMLDSLDSKIKSQNTFKFDDRLKEIQVDLIAKFNDIFDKIESKLEASIFNEQVTRLSEEMKRLVGQLDHKAERLDTKKAFKFLEEKLIEITQVVKAQEENVRNTLVSKKQLKCLSCDR
jgi:hypothetical protein